VSSKTFERRFADPPSIVFVRRVLIVFVAVHIPLALWSGYRAIIQVQRLELQSPGRTLGDGSTVRVDVVSSGRTPVDVSLEMIQGAHSETLGVHYVANGRNPAYDPRFRRGQLVVALTPERIARFQPGPALLRATARGRPQWLRTPPPQVREVPVELQQQPTP
jgi:hypothetical protein